MRFRKEWFKATIIATNIVADNVLEIEILPTNGVMPYSVGSHIDVQVFVNNKPEIRSYSLVGEFSGQKTYKIAVKKLSNSKGGSAYMWQLSANDLVSISQPANYFELNLFHEKYLLIAGGIGITPMLGMAQILSKRGVDISFLYLAHNTSEMPYLNDLANLKIPNFEVFESESSPTYDFQNLLQNLHPDTQVYMCGPLGMMNAVKKIWKSENRKPFNLRFETFGASGNFLPQSFRVEIPRLNRAVEVAENQSLLEVLEKEGIEMMFDCRKGECGLCAVNILSYTGDIDHRDWFFTEEQKNENKKMCTCVSRVVNGNIVIDTAYRTTE